MSTYEYQAMQASGNTVKGTIESDSERQARQVLRGRGLYPLSLESTATEKNVLPTFFSRIRPRDLTLITRQLASLLMAGIPLSEALHALTLQTEKRQVRRLVHNLRNSILEGHSFATACRQFPRTFPAIYTATVEAGEASGKLDNVLQRLADHFDAREETAQKVQLALVYPILLSLISVTIVVLLLIYVVPEVVGVYEDIGQQLPALTQNLIDTSKFLQTNGLYVLIALVLLIILSQWLLKQKAIRMRLDRFLLSIPLIGSYIRVANSALFTRTLAILNTSGVNLLDALRITAQVVKNTAITRAIEQASAKVKEGASLSKALEQTKRFPPLTVYLISSGESSGRLTEMLENVASNQERELSTGTQLFVSIMEPALILIMGIMVALIVVAMLLPIFEMNALI